MTAHAVEPPTRHRPPLPLPLPHWLTEKDDLVDRLAELRAMDAANGDTPDRS